MFVDYNNTLNYWFSCEHKHPLIDSQYCTHNILVAQVYWENQEPTCYDNSACLCLVCIIQGKDWKFNLIIKISKHFASRSILTRKFCSPIKKQLQQGGKSKQKQEWIVSVFENVSQCHHCAKLFAVFSFLPALKIDFVRAGFPIHFRIIIIIIFWGLMLKNSFIINISST